MSLSGFFRHGRCRLASLLVDKEFATALAQREASWRRVVALGVTTGVAVPGMSASLAYFDTYRCVEGRERNETNSPLFQQPSSDPGSPAPEVCAESSSLPRSAPAAGAACLRTSSRPSATTSAATRTSAWTWRGACTRSEGIRLQTTQQSRSMS